MRTKLEIKQINEDLTVYPAERETPTSRIIAIGDLHGNAMKLVYILLRQGIMDMPQNDFAALWSIYNKNTDDVTEADLEQFESIVNRATIVKPGLLVCIGDEFADRGKNDFFTALVFKMLHDSGVPYKIHLSNHGLYLISYLEALEWIKTQTPETMRRVRIILDKLAFLKPLTPLEHSIVPHLPLGKIYPLMDGQLNSMEGLNKLKTKFPKLKAKFDDLLKEAYFDHLVLLGYLQLDKGSFYLIGHAPVDAPILYGLAKSVEDQTGAINFSSNAEKIALIDKINLSVMNLVKMKQFSSSLIESLYTEQLRTHRPVDMSTFPDPVMQVLWNREPKGCLPDNMINIHGHTGPGVKFENSINLDSHWGKPEEKKFELNSNRQLVLAAIIPPSNQDVCDIISQPANKTHQVGNYYSDAVFNDPYSSQIYKNEVELQKNKSKPVDLEKVDINPPKRQKV